MRVCLCVFVCVCVCLQARVRRAILRLTARARARDHSITLEGLSTSAVAGIAFFSNGDVIAGVASAVPQAPFKLWDAASGAKLSKDGEVSDAGGDVLAYDGTTNSVWSFQPKSGIARRYRSDGLARRGEPASLGPAAAIAAFDAAAGGGASAVNSRAAAVAVLAHLDRLAAPYAPLSATAEVAAAAADPQVPLCTAATVATVAALTAFVDKAIARCVCVRARGAAAPLLASVRAWGAAAPRTRMHTHTTHTHARTHPPCAVPMCIDLPRRGSWGRPLYFACVFGSVSRRGV
jgi:hypothetical protein